MHNQRTINKKSFGKKITSLIVSEKFHKEFGLIVNYPDSDGIEGRSHWGYWVFSFLLCNTWWQASGFCTDEFSKFFSSSGRSTGFIEEYGNNTGNPANRGTPGFNRFTKQTK